MIEYACERCSCEQHCETECFECQECGCCACEHCKDTKEIITSKNHYNTVKFTNLQYK